MGVLRAAADVLREAAWSITDGRRHDWLFEDSKWKSYGSKYQPDMSKDFGGDNVFDVLINGEALHDRTRKTRHRLTKGEGARL